MKKLVLFVLSFLAIKGAFASDIVQPVLVINCPDGAATSYSGVAQPVTMTNICDGTATVRTSSGTINVFTSNVTEYNEYTLPSYIDKSTVTWTNGSHQVITLTADTQFVFSDLPNSGVVHLVILTGSGSHAATWPSSVKWPSGTIPTITQTGSATDRIDCDYSVSRAVYQCVWTGDIK